SAASPQFEDQHPEMIEYRVIADQTGNVAKIACARYGIDVGGSFEALRKTVASMEVGRKPAPDIVLNLDSRLTCASLARLVSAVAFTSNDKGEVQPLSGRWSMFCLGGRAGGALDEIYEDPVKIDPKLFEVDENRSREIDPNLLKPLRPDLDLGPAALD